MTQPNLVALQATAFVLRDPAANAIVTIAAELMKTLSAQEGRPVDVVAVRMAATLAIFLASEG